MSQYPDDELATDLSLAPAPTTIDGRRPTPPQPSATELMRRLTPRQQRFVRGYCLHGNAMKAVREAGYSVPGAPGHASRLLADHKVRAAIDQAMRESGPSPDQIIAELWKLAQFDPCEFDSRVYATAPDGRTVVDMAKVRELGLGKMLKRVSSNSRTGHQNAVWYDRLEVLALLGKLLGLTSDSTNVQVNVTSLSVEELRAIVSG